MGLEVMTLDEIESGGMRKVALRLTAEGSDAYRRCSSCMG
jgi:hypothetical protein